MRKPNILWVCTDQQRFDTLGCYGNPWTHTPNLDALAKTGVLFENAYCQNPVCAPSRASFLTGRYPRTTRCRQNGQTIPGDEVLVTKVLADAGYTCGLSGKLHLSACHPSVCGSGEKRIDDGYAEFHWSHHPGSDWPTNQYIHWLREHGVEYKTKPFPECKYVREGMPEELHHTTWCVQKAVNFIEATASSKHPWLFSVNLFDPHHAFDPPREYLDRYRQVLEDIPLPNYVAGELDDKPVWQRIDHEGAYGGGGGFSFDAMSETDHRWIKAAYWAMCDLIDAQVGRLLKTLEQTGQLKNTIVLFSSDHGEMLGDHGIYLKGPYFYEPAIRVPLILSWPTGIQADRKSTSLVELVDIAPTLLEMVGMEKHPGMQGRSLLPLLKGATSLEQHRNNVYCEFYGSNFHYDPLAYSTMVRDERFKLTVAHGQGMGELYDLEKDPEETTNLWGDPDYADVRSRLLVALTDRMAWTSDPLPEREAVW